MTFSIAARCPETNMFGVAISSSSICVTSRCAFTRSGVGAALTQNVTDPSLGNRMLDLLESERLSADEAVTRVAGATKHIRWRQLALVDYRGNAAHHSGTNVLGTHNAATGAQCVAIGNLLANDEVPAEMVRAFEAATGHLAARLVAALRRGLDAGGENGPVHSAGLQVVHELDWPIADLRVDWDEEPIPRLQSLWEQYEQEMQDYILRARDPDSSPPFEALNDATDG